MSSNDWGDVISAEERERALLDVMSEDRAKVVPAAKLLSEDASTTDEALRLLTVARHPDNRQGLLYALAWHGDLKAWNVAVEILGDDREHPTVRGQAAEVLAYAFMSVVPGGPDFTLAVPVLAEATKSPEPEVRYCAANTLGASGEPSLRPLLEALLNDQTPVPSWIGTVGDEAARALEGLDDMAIQRRRQRS